MLPSISASAATCSSWEKEWPASVDLSLDLMMPCGSSATNLDPTETATPEEDGQTTKKEGLSQR
jgi:hypothetical protein